MIITILKKGEKMDLYFQAWSKYATFSGRATRSEFWIFLLTNFVIQIILSIISAGMGLYTNLEQGHTLLDSLFALAVLLPTIAVMVRRLHDINMSGLWGWLFIPFGLPILIVGFIDSKEEQKQDEKVNNTSPVSVMSAVVNHSKDAISKVKPVVAEYVQTHQTTNYSKDTAQKQQSTISTKKEEIISYDNTVYEIDEDAIYEQVMIEVEEDKKVKSAWAKVLALSEGDTSKETSLYIQLRVSDIIEKKKNEIHNIELEKQKIQAKRDLEVWLDSETGLMWEMKTEENIKHRYVWSKEDIDNAHNPELLTDDVKDAFSYADKLNHNRFSGYDDWRVPTKEELKTLLTNRKSKIEGFEGKNYFIKDELSKNSSGYYWSSTTYEDGKSRAWIVGFTGGTVYDGNKVYNFYVRCVRAGQ